MNFDDFIFDLKIIIIDNLSYKDLINLSLVNKKNNILIY